MEQGRVTGAVVTFMDVTERIRAEEALRASEARKSAIMSSALDAIITIDREGVMVEFNAAAERMFGFRREEAVGREMAALIIPPALRERHRRGWRDAWRRARGRSSISASRSSAQRADGTEVPVELTVTAIPGGGHERVYGIRARHHGVKSGGDRAAGFAGATATARRGDPAASLDRATRRHGSTT